MKQKHTKRIKLISIIITSIVILSIFSSCDNSIQDIGNSYKKDRSIVDSGPCALNADNVTWTLYDDGELVISGTGAMPDYKFHEHTPWFMRYYNSIKSVTIGDNVTTVGDFAFSNCYYLSSVTLSDSVTSIGDYSFGDCESLSSIIIPDSVASIGVQAFNYCESLTSVTIGDGVTSIGEEAFISCNSLRSVIIPGSVTSIGDEAFSYCESLTSVNVDDSNSVYSSDESGVLFNKDKSELILYPQGKTESSYEIPYSVTSIGDDAFLWCENIISMTIPDSVTSIGECSFDGCTKLNSITISKSVTNIEYGAFLDCSNLYMVHYTGTEEQWNDITIGGCNDKLLDATIYYNS